MTRGNLVPIALQGEFGKPRPALVIQSNYYHELPSLTVLPLTSTCIEAPLIRVDIQPSQYNALLKPSQVMVDKIITVKKEKVGTSFGQLEADILLQVERCLAVFLGIVK